MSAWDIGKDDVSEETQAFKDKISSKETENAGLRSRLVKREAELDELRNTLNETLNRLSQEADRALRFENNLMRRSEELKNEKITSHNTETALAATQERLKVEERTKKELEAIIDSLSGKSDTLNVRTDKLQDEKRALEKRVRDLEARILLQDTRPPPLPVSRGSGRPRSSSVANSRTVTLERELQDSISLSLQREKELVILQAKLSQVQNELIKAENERMAMEKMSKAQIQLLQSSLQEKNEEIESSQTIQGDNYARQREDELLSRIEEDEAKIIALEKLFSEQQDTGLSRNALKEAEEKLRSESYKLSITEACLAKLTRDKEGAIQERDSARQEIARTRTLLREKEAQIEHLSSKEQSLPDQLTTISNNTLMMHSRLSPSLVTSIRAASADGSSDVNPPSISGRAGSLPSNCWNTTPHDANDKEQNSGHLDESVLADYVATLLGAIDRLRVERDDLKRSLEFLETESRFTVEALQKKLVSSSQIVNEPSTGFMKESELGARGVSLDGDPIIRERKITRLTTVATAFAIMHNHLQQRADSAEERLSHVVSNLFVAESRRQDACRLGEDRSRLLEESNSRVQDLRNELENFKNQLIESKRSRDDISLVVSSLTSREQALTSELEVARASCKDTRDTLDQMAAQMSDMTKSYQDADSQRNSLCVQVTNLQSELSRVQEELSDAQCRYGDLQAQQLSSMPSSEVTRNLRDQISELEMRVLRRTEQIGIHQHDIRRLETNLKLQEERVAEMTSELETLGAQKEAMVEDCAEAREARDEAIQKLETAELELERMEERLRTAEEEEQETLAATVAAFAETVTQSRNTIRIIRQSATKYTQTSLEAERRVDELEKANKATSDEWRQRFKVMEGDLEESTTLRHSLANSLKARDADLLQMTVALAVTHTSLNAHRRQIQADVVEVHPIERSVSSSDSKLEHELERLSRQHADDLDELQTELKHLKAELENIRSLRDDAELRCQQTQEEAVSSLQELKDRLISASQAYKELEVEQARIQTDHEQQLDLLNEELCSTKAALETAQQSHARLDSLHREAVQKLAEVEDDYSCRLAQANDEVLSRKEDHQRIIAAIELKFSQEIEQVNARVDETLHELHQTQIRLQEESDLRMREREAHENEIQTHAQRHENSESLQSDLRQAITDTHKQLDYTESQLGILQAEKHSLQIEITGLEAEVQKSLSLTRYLERQIKESDESKSGLKEALDKIRLELDQSEKTGKAAEINLALQTAQHEQVLSTLRRELSALKAKPDLEEVVHELREKNREMDEVLRNKCTEIEEYDDRILETLKANKKLTAKVESLTRKIQNLQSKLATNKSSMPEFHASEPGTVLTGNPQLHSIPRVPSLPIHQAAAPVSFNFAADTVSAPTNLHHPTAFPERRVTQPAVFQARTPEKRQSADPVQSGPSTSKKRPAPDDDERSNVPPEGHYPEQEPIYNRSNTNTPRLRRTLHMSQSGFTPVRNSAARPTVNSSSPVRRVTTAITTAMTGSHFISDVTNSPRAASGQIADAAKASKRSWLGKIRGAPPAAHSTSRSSSRPHVFARMPKEGS